MNTDVMFSSKNEMWTTPQDFFDKLDAEFHFTLDAAATKENAKCPDYFTEEQNGLLQRWSGTVFCNPPYCRKTGLWVKKAFEESQAGHCIAVMLLPCRPDVSWFHDYILGNAEIRFIRGRLKFGGSKNSAPFPSMVVVFRPSITVTKDKALLVRVRDEHYNQRLEEQYECIGGWKVSDPKTRPFKFSNEMEDWEYHG